MLEQAADFLAESRDLDAVVGRLGDADLARETAFKGWTVEDIIGHLHIWNEAARMALEDEDAFRAFFAKVATHLQEGDMNAFERAHLGHLPGAERVAAWRAGYENLAALYGDVDPATRIPWAGPSMSARSAMTARQMETWAHGQAIYDLLGLDRTEHDRIRNIVVLGVNTYGWTFKVNGEEVPEPMPYLVLEAPSGAIWTFGEESETERIEGSAVDFCRVVAQTRNIADTDLKVTGDNARRWMAMAQCFAGPPNPPPPPGTRRKFSGKDRDQSGAVASSPTR